MNWHFDGKGVDRGVYAKSLNKIKKTNCLSTIGPPRGESKIYFLFVDM